MDLSYRGFLWLVSVIAVFILAGAATAVFRAVNREGAGHKAVVEIEGGSRVLAAVAKSSEERARGLAGRVSLGESEGMLFVTDKPEPQIFWMKGMLIPLDIIWIRGGVVVGVETGVPPPLSAAVDASLARYRSPVAVDQVLEVPAGFVERHRISAGDRVKIKAPD